MSFDSLPTAPDNMAPLKPDVLEGRIWFLVHEKKVPQQKARQVALKFDLLYAQNSIGLVDQCWEAYLKDAQKKFDRASLRKACFSTAQFALAICMAAWITPFLGRHQGLFLIVQLFLGLVGGVIISFIVVGSLGWLFWNQFDFGFKDPKFLE